MESTQLRDRYLDFFKNRGHAVISSASLIPDNDPSVLFTTSGMHPLVPYLLGAKHPEGHRLTDVQKCLRTQDIDEVGDARHHTFFEMLGNWSLGEYFKNEAIKWSLEFLTSKQEGLALDKNLIAVSVFAGDEDSPFDEDSFNIWKSLGIPESRIAKLPKKNNWWGMATGPCGPDTEIFYWSGNPAEVTERFDPDDSRWVEIWNNVFMQYRKDKDGKFYSLPQKNVDTGMGLERALTALNGLDDDYKTDLFRPLIRKIEKLSLKRYEESDEIKKSMRIIADHMRAATIILADDRHLIPGNVEHGYIVRRLIRRSIRHGRLIGIKTNFCKEIAVSVIENLEGVYPELSRNRDFILNEIEKEENAFKQTLEKGIREFEKVIGNTDKQSGVIPGKEAFRLYETYGFPLEMIRELAQEKGLVLDEQGFKDALEKHRELSRSASEQRFKGGLADDSEMTKRLHTATHLLHQALRNILGSHVQQRGSNITSERLRFDFSHPEKMTDEQIRCVQDEVNLQIKQALPVLCKELSMEDAKQSGALGFFEEKYGRKVTVYSIGESDNEYYSKEICGGPHAANTRELGNFRILKEEASAAGVRRIKAVLI